MITLRIWLHWNTNIAQLETMGMNVSEDKYGRRFIHITHPHCSPLIHLLPKEAVEEVELHDYSVDELAIADGTRIARGAILCAISAEATWFDERTHLIQHIVARGKSIRDVMGLYFIALKAKDVATARQPD